MKSVYLLLSALALTVYVSSCGKDPDNSSTDNGTGTDNTTNDPFPSDLDEYVSALTGSTKDSSEKMWVGSQAFRSYFNSATQEYEDESEVTDDPDIEFKKMSLSMKYDKYNTERFGYNVGSLEWIDPDGKSGMNWELENETPDSLYVNRNKTTQQTWGVVKLNDTHFEFTRKWKSGGARFIERLIWVKE